MQPVPLCFTAHDEQAAVWQGQRIFQVFVLVVTQLEGAFLSETDGGDNGVGAELCFVVAVPSHAIAAIAIQIEQNAVELHAAAVCFHALFNAE